MQKAATTMPSISISILGIFIMLPFNGSKLLKPLVELL